MFSSIKKGTSTLCRTSLDHLIKESEGRQIDGVLLLKVIITKEATLPAKRAAEADGFVIIELGKKAEAENAREIYELVYRAFNEIFASIAPPKLMGIVSRIEEAMETLKKVVEELTSLLTRRTER